VVTLTFNTNANNDQLPLTRMWIDWNDGTGIFDSTGETNEKPSANDPHMAAHTYSCIPNTTGSKCVACTDSAITPDTDGRCSYPAPKINIEDHWEWCFDGHGITGGGTNPPEPQGCDIIKGQIYGGTAETGPVTGNGSYYIIVGPE
jgi:hypothetical protein